ncbi:ATP-binding cassette domain-containing protein [Desulfobulbus alkaliphilus]|uniref:ATP-binding cassette domain-containing protein n=1 Tax=Desulfobulbus alkaliphilus TaxID=869814 RepID=UPI001962A988|nr:ATP-binding cassette domain-containing protein [Desulfobulbus alkaliphilus]MBM9537877.1 ATP-binding cassette domain-containing protein [Desulfobulbus alkaliphilus]
MKHPDGLLLHRVTISLGALALIPETTLTVAPGEITTVMGPSGTGKSTLLNYLCGTLAPAFSASGQIFIHGRDISALPIEKRRIGILFQDDLLFPHMSVGENLLFALPRSVKGRHRRQDLAEQALDEAGLAGYYQRSPGTLSGGQRARVALMRTLLSNPEIILLDEPFAKLDTELRTVIRQFVFAHIAARALPTLLVTHDIRDAEAAGGPLLSLGARATDHQS